MIPVYYFCFYFQVLPFVLLGLGIDDSFVICNAFGRTDPRAPIPDRMAEGLASSGEEVVFLLFSFVITLLFQPVPLLGTRPQSNSLMISRDRSSPFFLSPVRYTPCIASFFFPCIFFLLQVTACMRLSPLFLPSSKVTRLHAQNILGTVRDTFPTNLL